jgi:hypothetical protein
MKFLHAAIIRLAGNEMAAALIIAALSMPLLAEAVPEGICSASPGLDIFGRAALIMLAACLEIFAFRHILAAMARALVRDAADGQRMPPMHEALLIRTDTEGIFAEAGAKLWKRGGVLHRIAVPRYSETRTRTFAEDFACIIKNPPSRYNRYRICFGIFYSLTGPFDPRELCSMLCEHGFFSIADMLHAAMQEHCDRHAADIAALLESIAEHPDNSQVGDAIWKILQPFPFRTRMFANIGSFEVRIGQVSRYREEMPSDPVLCTPYADA